MFTKATKKQLRLKMALVGPSGSGKTWTALAIATHLVPGGKIAFIDTEHGSASLYASDFDFDVLELDSFSVENYIAAINEAEVAGYDVLIIDSLSHAWAGKDGILEYKDKVAAATSSKDDFGAWRKATPKHNSLVERILTAHLHVLATMRVKTDYVVERGADGKNHPRKVGLQPIQRDQLEYEFAVVADIDAEHNLIVTKSRCSALTDMVVNKAGQEVADILRQWLQVPPVAEVSDFTQVTTQFEAVLGTKLRPEQPVSPPAPAPVPSNGHVTDPGNGHQPGTSAAGVKAATIKTGKWAMAAKSLSERCSFYAKPDGQPAWYRMTEDAAKCGFVEITDANLGEVIAALEKQAADSQV